MDIELAIDVMDMAAHVDHIVVMSGDGDFRRLVEAVQRRGVRCSVISTMRTRPPMIADELRRQADNFIELADIQQEIVRTNYHHASRDHAAIDREDDEDHDCGAYDDENDERDPLVERE